jgi:NAD+ kinase
MKKKEITKIGIILKPSNLDDISNLLTHLVRWLNRREKQIYFLVGEETRLSSNLTPKTLKLINLVEDNFIYKKTDLLISLGGDGTLLGVCRNISSKVPVFGVNLGRLGFITEFSKKEFYEKLNIIFLGRYELIKTSLFSVEVSYKNEVRKEYFLNDAVFTKNDIARMFTLSVSSNNEHVYDLSGDGLIVSSTYGSTAYSLAAGGPIVHPEVKAMILTPICAHSLTHRPLVIPDNFELQIKLLDKIDTVNITMDGQVCLHIKHGSIIKISKETRKSVSIIKNIERTYFHTLKEKFVHGRREVY